MPAAVWTLAFVSLLMDISSERIHSLLPLFLVSALGVSVLAVGIIAGVAEATALISKVFSGTLSDRLGRRKPRLDKLDDVQGAQTDAGHEAESTTSTQSLARSYRVGMNVSGQKVLDWGGGGS